MDVKDKVESVKSYFREVYLEGKRITWPSKKDAVKGTYIVLITVVVAAIFLGIVDVGLAKIIQALLRG
ncbi:MAG: preprotein translocase subunit SecE [Syntrophorhabdus sp. PtaU1.Bin050]|jgi:preprotein translocase subunit SecE|nr:MAG: preprotein translocase subunit SecE [Syntrophorhabdus sp. PtaU1.Bin050]